MPARTLLTALVSALLGVSTAALTAGQALAKPPAGASEASIELLEITGKDAHRAVRFEVALDEDERPSVVEISDARAAYRVNIGRKRETGNTAVVHLDLKRTETAPPRHNRGALKRSAEQTARISLRSRVALGRRVVLGRMTLAGDRGLEVAITLR